MIPGKEFKLAGGLAVVLFITGVLCYSVFKVPVPEEPVRMMFKGSAGNVLFTHQEHAQDYDLECISCHHNIEDDEIYNCSECHESGSSGEDMDPMSRTDALHAQCIGCHEEAEAGPVECAACHASAQ